MSAEPSADSCSRSCRQLYASEKTNMINLIQLYRKTATREESVQFAVDHGMVPSSKMCSRHKIPMRIIYSQNKNVGSFICNRGKCRLTSKVARGKGTWFENIKISMTRVFYLMYAFTHCWSYETVIREDPEKTPESCLSMATVADWYRYCRETVVLYQLDREQNIGKIGGPGKVVRIDKSKFGKRKYNKGCHLEGHWVIGMIEDGNEDLRLEVCPGHVRSADVLLPLIQKHVMEGSIVYTDSWLAYSGLSQNGYIHKKVNDSDPLNPFVAPDGTKTLRIESQWRVIKKIFKNANFNHPDTFADVIIEYLWRRSVNKNKKDVFLELIKAINFVYKH